MGQAGRAWPRVVGCLWTPGSSFRTQAPLCTNHSGTNDDAPPEGGFWFCEEFWYPPGTTSGKLSRFSVPYREGWDRTSLLEQESLAWDMIEAAGFWDTIQISSWQGMQSL